MARDKGTDSVAGVHNHGLCCAKHPVFPGLLNFALSHTTWFQVVVLAFI